MGAVLGVRKVDQVPRRGRNLRRSPITTKKIAGPRWRCRDWLVEHHPAGKAWAALVAAKEKKADDEGGARDALRQRLIEGKNPGPSAARGELLEYHQRKHGRRGGGTASAAKKYDDDGELLDDAPRKKKAIQRSRAD
jgi:hypothetical protein